MEEQAKLGVRAAGLSVRRVRLRKPNKKPPLLVRALQDHQALGSHPSFSSRCPWRKQSHNLVLVQPLANLGGHPGSLCSNEGFRSLCLPAFSMKFSGPVYIFRDATIIVHYCMNFISETRFSWLFISSESYFLL